ncbi:MAG: tyrosine-type recombinase/integrase [Phycisphaerae bacterium]
MAWLLQRGESWSVQFNAAGGARRTVALGEIAKKSAQGVLEKIERLIHARRTNGAPPPEVAAWLAGLGEVLYERLAGVGLVEPRRSASLKAFADGYVKSRGDWSVAARVQFELATADAVHFFGADCRLGDINPADADRFRAHLAQRLAPATVRKRVRFVKQLLRAAVRGRLLSENPFADQKTSNVTDRSRLVYVPAELVLKVADELSTPEVRLVFLLARFAGLRTPSECDALRWSDVNFAAGTMNVFAPKTDRTRVVPILPQVEGELLRTHAAAPDGSEFVLQDRRKLPVLRRAVELAAKRAGVRPWPKMFQNLRASFATDVVRNLPANAAAAVLGHSRAVAAEHYWTTNDDDFGALRAALHSPARIAPASANAPTSTPASIAESSLSKWNADEVGTSMGVTGLEPVTSSV